MKLSSFKNVYGVVTVAICLVALALTLFSVQGAFVGLLLVAVAAGLRLLFTLRQIAEKQLAVEREIASWLSSLYHQQQTTLSGRGGTPSETKPQA